MNGILFIGDPHVTRKNPGRRTGNYLRSVLGKLERAAEIAREHDLLPVILGDLFHKAAENDLRTLSRLITSLRKFHMTPLCVGGNHDKAGSLLAGGDAQNALAQAGEIETFDVDALSLLAQVGEIEVFDGECQLARIIETACGPVHLWMAPYGTPLPERIERNGAYAVILVTHHDLAFAGAYPGAAELREIAGCDLVVNGHMHKTSPSVQKGITLWHNPGNIEPLSVDCIDHEPAVWAWVPSDKTDAVVKTLIRFPLPHERECFDMTGLQVTAAPATAAVGTAPALVDVAPSPIVASSQFAALLSEQASTMDASRKEDNSAFLEDIQRELAELPVGPAAKTLILGLAEKIAL